MADQKAPQMQATLGLTGLTSNAMALIAPGAFLWLTFFIQASTGVAGQPSTAPAMWMGIFAALLLCLATAVAYAEISKLYPGTGSSYYYAEQAMLSKDASFKYARIAKFIVGWGSHLYYWVYPGVMVATTGIFVGYVVGFLFPSFLSGSNPGPLFMALIAILFSFFVAWIASKGAGASTAVNLAINVVQISALVLFSVLALGYRASHPAGTSNATTFQYDTQTQQTYTYQFATNPKDGSTIRDASGTPQPLLDKSGKPVPFVMDYPATDATGNMLTHPNAASVVGIHKFSWVFIQATVAILILVGFESVTAMGGEAKNPTKHIPIAVIASLLIQGLVCYLFEYFAANYFLNSGYTMQSATGSAAPIGDMMIIVGDALLGQGHGQLLHARRGVHGVPGAHRYHAELHEYWRPRDLCDGQGRRSSRALRDSARRVSVAAARHLDPGCNLRGHRLRGCIAWYLPMPLLPPTQPSPRCRTTSSPVGVTCRTTRWPSCPTR